MDDLFELCPEIRKLDPIAAEMKAGDAAFHNGLIAHAAGANMTNNTRAAMTCAFMPEVQPIMVNRTYYLKVMLKNLKLETF